MLFPNFFQVDFEEVRVIVDEGRLQGQRLAPLGFKIVLGHVGRRNGQPVKWPLLNEKQSRLVLYLETDKQKTRLEVLR